MTELPSCMPFSRKTQVIQVWVFLAAGSRFLSMLPVRLPP
jgi:hypothetical protein